MEKPIGAMIADRLKEIGMSKAEFGRRMNCSRQNVSLIVKKESIDTGVLKRAGKVLGCDFFQMLSDSTGDGPQRIDLVLSEVRITGIVKVD